MTTLFVLLNDTYVLEIKLESTGANFISVLIVIAQNTQTTVSKYHKKSMF